MEQSRSKELIKETQPDQTMLKVYEVFKIKRKQLQKCRIYSYFTIMLNRIKS